MAGKSDDCYFFYYSTCTKGDMCPFRHCAEALGNETMCMMWAEGRCYRPETCRFRHMEIKKDRSQIYCYWETQPGGCKKLHCAFKHLNAGSGDALAKLPEPVTSSTPDSSVAKKSVPQLDQDVNTPSPKIDPIVFNPFEEDSDRESVGIATPKKAVSKPVRVPPAKTGKIKLTKTVPDEDQGLGFEIKSLDVLKSEKIAKAKQILNEADKLVSTQSTFEEGDDVNTPDTTVKITSPGRVSTIKRLGGVTSSKAARPASTGTVRRIVASSQGDDDSYDSEPVEGSESEPKQKRIAVLKEDSGKADKPVSRRVNLNKGRRIIIADDEVKADKPTTTTRRVSPKKSSILSRIGIQTEPAGATKKGSIQSRLGHKKVASTDTTSLDDLPGCDVRKLELERARLSARLKRLEEEEDDSDSGSRQEEEGRGDLVIKSLEDIQREKALESMKQNRLKKVQQAKEQQSKVDESKSTGVKKRVLTTRRSGRQEQQIYKPPGAKLKEAENPSLKERLGKRKITPEKVSPGNKNKQGENSENVPKKKSGWGVKTFSEIMQEKRQQRLAAKSSDNRKSDSDKSSEQLIGRKPSKMFTPITFDDGDKQNTNSKVTTTKRKFTPVVFDLDSKEEGKKSTAKKLKPVVFDEDKRNLSRNDDTAQTKAQHPEIRRSVSKEQPEKTTPSPRRQLSRQQSNKSLTEEITTTTTTVRKLKRRSSSQISNAEANSSTVKTRRRSSGASRKSSIEKPPAAVREDSLDLLDDEFEDLLGDVVDVDIENTSALQTRNDDDLLQEMEELLA